MILSLLFEKCNPCITEHHVITGRRKKVLKSRIQETLNLLANFQNFERKKSLKQKTMCCLICQQPHSPSLSLLMPPLCTVGWYLHSQKPFKKHPNAKKHPNLPNFSLKVSSSLGSVVSRRGWHMKDIAPNMLNRPRGQYNDNEHWNKLKISYNY